MQWSDFLAEVADTHLLSPEQKAAFLARLDDKNDKNGQSEAKVASNLNISVAAFKKRMSEVYDKFAPSCPELASSKRGKLEKLRACLRAKYTERLTGTPTTSNSQVGKAHPTPNAPTPTLYENLGRKGVERDRFIGRDEKLKELHDLLQENTQVAITAAIIGMGGVGKTELAIQYAREHLTSYQGGVCWLPANDFALKLVEFARPRFFPNVNFDRYSLQEEVAYCWQHWADGEVLLVLDDVTNYKQQVQPYLPESSRFKVLITTRERLGKPIVLLDLEVLAPAEALDLLKSLLGNERVERELDIAAELCDWLGYLPLGLELVGRYLDHPTMKSLSIAQMLEELKEERLANEALEEADYEGMTAQLGVRDAFNLSWKRLDSNAQQLGCLLSLFALAPIPRKLIEGVYHFWQGEEFKPKDLRKPFWALNDLHLLKTEKETYSLHQLIREFFREKLEELEQSDEMKRAFAFVMVAVADQISQWSSREEIVDKNLTIPHLAEVAKHLTNYLNDEDFGKPFVGLGCFYMSQGFYDLAETWIEQCLDITQARLGSEHPNVAASLNNLAWLYKEQGRYKEAETRFKQALELKKCLLGENDSSVATGLNNLAMVYQAQSSYREAEPLFQQALEMRQQLLGKEHQNVADSLSNLANLYNHQGRYREAESLFRQALVLYKRLLGEEHSHVATVCDNLGNCYTSQGRYREAEPLYRQALELRQRLLPEEHPQVATSFYHLAYLYESQGCYNEAQPLYVQALVIRERRLGSNHHQTVKIREDFANFLRQAIRKGHADLEALRDNASVQAILERIQATFEC